MEKSITSFSFVLKVLWRWCWMSRASIDALLRGLLCDRWSATRSLHFTQLPAHIPKPILLFAALTCT